MLWADKVSEWKNNDVTKALQANIEEALIDINSKLIEEIDVNSLLRLQGLARAYLDVQDVIENMADNKPVEGE